VLYWCRSPLQTELSRRLSSISHLKESQKFDFHLRKKKETQHRDLYTALHTTPLHFVKIWKPETWKPEQFCGLPVCVTRGLSQPLGAKRLSF
jgi:hypothetical protein